MSEVATKSTPLIPAEVNGLKRNRIIILIATLYFNVLLAAVDTTIVTTLIGHIGSDLNALSQVSWVAAGYTVAYSAFQPLYGKFSDIWGRKTVSMFSTLMFAVGCLMCGVAQGMVLLVMGRFVSGIGAGGMLSMSTVTVSDYVPLRSRGVFQGMGNISFGIGASLGGVLGGWLTNLGGWRFAFSSQVPPALLSIVLQYFLLADKKEASSAARLSAWNRIDWVGSFSLVSALLLTMMVITTGGNQFAWISAPVMDMFASSICLLTLFVYWEKNRAVDPVIPMNIIMHRTVISACLTNFFASAGTYAFMFYTPIFLQSVYHYGFSEVGHRVVVNFFGVAVGSMGSGLIMRRTGKYHTLGFVCCLMLLLSSAMILVSPLAGPSLARAPIYQSISYILNGLGYAGMLTVTLLALIAAVEPKYQATTTAAQYTFRGAGSSLGIALAAAVFQNTLVHELVKYIGNDTEKKQKIITKVSKSLEAIWQIPKKYQPTVIKSYGTAGLAVQGFCVVMALMAIIFTLLMQEHDLVPRIEDVGRASTPPGPTLHE